MKRLWVLGTAAGLALVGCADFKSGSDIAGSGGNEGRASFAPKTESASESFQATVEIGAGNSPSMSESFSLEQIRLGGAQ